VSVHGDELLARDRCVDVCPRALQSIEKRLTVVGSRDYNRGLSAVDTFGEVPRDVVDKGRFIALLQLHEVAVGSSLID